MKAFAPILPGAKTVSRFTHLSCSGCGAEYESDRLQTVCTREGCGQPLLAVYDFRKPLPKRKLRRRVSSMWRYRELLPVGDDAHILSLGEGMTPLLPSMRLAALAGMQQLYIKDESANPTASFKARGLSMAVSKARELGVQACVIPTAGNAGGALSAYCARGGLEAHVFMPADTPEMFKLECRQFGASLQLVDGLISDCGRIIQQHPQRHNWFDVSTLKEPYRLEGKKTMGYEIAEQLGWEVPDVIIYPTGGGTGLIGIWKALDEMQQLGWVGSKRPRMVAVQAEGCQPIVQAFEQGKNEAEFFPHAATIASGLRVPFAYGHRLILKVLRESNGTAVAVSDAEILEAVQEIAQCEGLFVAPEGAATWAACKRLLNAGWLEESEKVVLLNTGSGYKYAGLQPTSGKQ